YRILGVPAEKVQVTGNVKYDGVLTDRDNPRTRELGRLLGILRAGGVSPLLTASQLTESNQQGTNAPRSPELILVGGSPQAPEEEILLGISRRAREQFPNLRLILVPRQKDRFDEVAELLQRSGEPFLRRSEITLSPGRPVTLSSGHPVILVDTIGELGAIW